MKTRLVVLEESDFWVEFGKNVHTGVIPPYLAVSVVTWAVEKTWEGGSREVFDFINGLCHHLTFLLPPYLPLTFFCFPTECSTSWLGKRDKASEGAAEQAINNHSGTLQRQLSALLAQQTWRFHPKGLFLSELHMFPWIVAFRQISQQNDTRFSRAAQSSLNV